MLHDGIFLSWARGVCPREGRDAAAENWGAKICASAAEMLESQKDLRTFVDTRLFMSMCIRQPGCAPTKPMKRLWCSLWAWWVSAW